MPREPVLRPRDGHGCSPEVGGKEISRPFLDRWQVAGRDVRLIEVTASHLTDEPWVATYWTEDGYPEPEAALLAGREAARRWVLDDPRGQQPADLL